jgi:hypothetical protein
MSDGRRCSGDTVYSDGPISATVPLPDGSLWRNLVTPGEVEGGRDAGSLSTPRRGGWQASAARAG